MPPKTPRQRKTTTDRTWNLDEIQELIDLLAKNEVSEFEMERAGVKVRIRRGSPRPESWSPAGMSESVADVPPALGPSTPESPRPAAAVSSEVRAPESAEGLYIIKSPIVGTYYSAPAPNAPQFVKLGDHVEVGPLAEEEGADMMVLTSQGRGGYNALLLGSVADYVVQNTHAPVFMVPIQGESNGSHPSNGH